MLKMPFLSNYSLFYSIIPFFLFLSRTKQRTKKTNLKPTKKKALTTSKKPRGSKALWLNFLLLHFKRFKRKKFVIFYTKKQRKGKRERKKEREKEYAFFGMKGQRGTRKSRFKGRLLLGYKFGKLS